MSAGNAIEGRKFSLAIADMEGAAPKRIALMLSEGLTYRAVVRSAALQKSLVASFAESDLAAVVPPDGGFVGNLKVWENLVLPAAYHGQPRLEELDARAGAIFRRIGGDGRSGAELCAQPPVGLSHLELRCAAFVRAMLVEPEIMVYDSLFEGLTRPEVEQVLAFDRVFHLYFPFRTSIWVDLELPMLPEVAARETFLI
jgi:ABC-type transporter Mla maintaining outer membrane lipid asymmetry ATPase subunit MlaF